MHDTAPRNHVNSAIDPAIWHALVVFGAILTALGALNLSALWIPDGPDSPAGVFSTVSTFLDEFAQVALGLTMMISGTVAQARPGATRGIAVLCCATSIALWFAVFLYLDALPYILQVSARPNVQLHVRKAAIKTFVQALVYPLCLILLAIRAWRATLAPRGV